MEQQYYRMVYALPFVTLIGLVAMFTMTDPLSAGPGGMLLVFFLVYLLSASAFFILLHGGIALVSRIINKYRKSNGHEWKMGVRKAYYIASVIAFGPVLLLAMQSVGQLQLRDVVLTAMFLCIAIFYVVKRS